ncbi:hypothetical protein D1007_49915 [Hordeum vulgare]|nr:hypothetical protein D1007_49915 [Hordeum vulgare]
MAPAGKKGKVVAPPASVAPIRLTLLPSRVLKAENLGLVLLFMAGDTHEWVETIVWSASSVPSNLVRSTYPFFLHNIYAGLVPPFSAFFCAILSHCRVRALHRQPNSVLLLAVYAFYCEAFVGVRPSVVLFCHFFNLRSTAPGQPPCVSPLSMLGVRVPI